MKLIAIKNLIKIKHSNNGKKSLRNPYEIRNGAVERHALDKLEERRQYREAPVCGIDKSLKEFVRRKWKQAGYSPASFSKLGVVKCMQILNNK